MHPRVLHCFVELGERRRTSGADDLEPSLRHLDLDVPGHRPDLPFGFYQYVERESPFSTRAYSQRVGFFRRKQQDSLDPQYLLAQANAATPPPTMDGTGFRLTVQDVFSIRGRGTVVTGRVESGTIRTGDTLRQTRTDGTTRDVTVTGIELIRKITDQAAAGDDVGLLLRDLGRDDIGAGDVLSR